MFLLLPWRWWGCSSPGIHPSIHHGVLSVWGWWLVIAGRWWRRRPVPVLCRGRSRLITQPAIHRRGSSMKSTSPRSWVTPSTIHGLAVPSCAPTTAHSLAGSYAPSWCPTHTVSSTHIVSSKCIARRWRICSSGLSHIATTELFILRVSKSLHLCITKAFHLTLLIPASSCTATARCG